MKIVVTGATGNLGKSVVNFLKNQKHQLLLVGRNQKKLEQVFGNNIACTSYEKWQMYAENFDAMIHLAARNNDQTGSLEEFREANVVLLQQLIKGMVDAGIPKLVYFTSLHAKEAGKKDPYSQTKREAENWLDAEDQIEVIKLRLPAVYSETTKGSLRHINNLPRSVQSIALNIAKCLRPVVTIDRVLEDLAKVINEKNHEVEILVSDQQMGNPVYRSVKTVIDVSAGLFIAIFLSWWLLTVIWVIIKLTSKGPGIFIQERVGKNQKVFLCYKFRTMNVGTVQAGTHEVATSNITPIGNFLRKTKLDELPQFINLLKNEMSLIGPRPCLPNQHELIEERDKRQVFAIKPGISGLAQVKNIDMSNPKKLAVIDAFYLDTRTTLLDLHITLATVFSRFRRGLSGS